jgi:glucose-1-phosphate cytidylyltransferase
VDTGIGTGTGGRIKRVEDWLDGEQFMPTYGDGVATVDFDKLVDFDLSSGCAPTVTAVCPSARFGGLNLDVDSVVRFGEKRFSEGWLNGGFTVLSGTLLDRIHGEGDSLETDMLEGLSDAGELAAFRHEGFWQCMDTPRDVRLLLDLWNSGSPPWKS